MKSYPALLLSVSLLTLIFWFGHLSSRSRTGSCDEHLRSATCGVSATPTPTPSPEESPPTEILTEPGWQILLPEREPTYQEYLDGGLGSSDVDCDGIKNIDDNCVLVYNPNQKRTRSDEYGDACNPKLKKHKTKDFRCDSDRDGIYDHLDNCPGDPNRDQKDANCDEVGDACDTDPKSKSVNLCPNKSKKRSTGKSG